MTSTVRFMIPGEPFIAEEVFEATKRGMAEAGAGVGGSAEAGVDAVTLVDTEGRKQAKRVP